jgi:DNA end-binding protein Ku
MSELSLPSKEKLVPSEINLATQLIDGMTGTFDPARYHDSYTEEVKKMVEAKAKGQKRVAPVAKPAKSNVIDLVAALQESLGTVKKGKRRTAA